MMAGVVPALVILGAPRSGTTLLYKALCLHPDVAFVSNWLRRFPTVPDLAVLNRVARRAPRLRRRWWFGPSSNAYVYGGWRSLPGRLFPAPVEGEPVFVACGLGVDARGDPEPSPRRPRDLAALCERISTRSGGRVFVTKRIAHNLRVRELAAALPGARFVELVRDGRAVAHSLASVDWWAASPVWWSGGTPAQWVAAGGDPWELPARHWVEERRRIEDGLAALPSGHVRRVRYERLVAHPVSTLAAVAEFAGLDSPPSWRRDLERLAWHPGERWRTEMPPGALATVERVQGSALARLGYR